MGPSTRAKRLFWRITGIMYPAHARPARGAIIPLWLMAFLIASPLSLAFAETEGPRPITRENPEYPKGALRRGVEGSVLLEFTVDGRGNVVAPRVIEATPRGVFDAAALKALSTWKYEALGTETTNIKVKLTFR